jgi:hypothetical protein
MHGIQTGNTLTHTSTPWDGTFNLDHVLKNHNCLPSDILCPPFATPTLFFSSLPHHSPWSLPLLSWLCNSQPCFSNALLLLGSWSVNYIVLNEKQLLNVNVLGLTYLKNMGIKWGFFSPPPILWCSHSDNHPQEERAKFGHRSERTVDIF